MTRFYVFWIILAQLAVITIGRCCSVNEGRSQDDLQGSFNFTKCEFMTHNSSVLRHSPKIRWPAFHPGPCLAWDMKYRSQKPLYSVLVTVYNRAQIIRETLVQLLRMTTGDWELIIIFDGCSDNSLQVAKRVLVESIDWPQCNHPNNISRAYEWKSGSKQANARSGIGEACYFQQPSLVRSLLVNVPRTGIFATAANNVQMLSASGEYFILFDDDQIMTVKSWNEKLVIPFLLWEDVFSVSMRCAHGWGSGKRKWWSGGESPKCKNSKAAYRDKTPEKCIFTIRDSGIRGPLAIRADYVHKLGYLDEINFAGVITAGCDHDLNKRAYDEYAWVSGNVQIPYTEERCCRSKSSKKMDFFRKKYVEWFKERKLKFNNTPAYSPANSHNGLRVINSSSFDLECAIH